MKIVVPVKQVPDLVEELEITPEGKGLDTTYLRLVINEIDDHALEQALILKERYGGEVTALTIDTGEVDEMLFTAIAKGADKAIKIKGEFGPCVDSHTYAKIVAEVVKAMDFDLIVTGCQAIDDLDGQIGVLLSSYLNLPYIGLVTKVEKGDGELIIYKEYPGGINARYTGTMPLVLGVISAETPPRYVLFAKLRSVMREATIDEVEAPQIQVEPGIEIIKMYKPEVGKGAEIISGTPEEIADQIARLLVERGIVK